MTGDDHHAQSSLDRQGEPKDSSEARAESIRAQQQDADDYPDPLPINPVVEAMKYFQPRNSK